MQDGAQCRDHNLSYDGVHFFVSTVVGVCIILWLQYELMKAIDGTDARGKESIKGFKKCVLFCCCWPTHVISHSNDDASDNVVRLMNQCGL